jgi:hypothetical protein
MIGKGSYDKEPWSKWYAWRPVCTVSGRWVWLETVYRQARVGPAGVRHLYGDVFDVVKDA